MAGNGVGHEELWLCSQEITVAFRLGDRRGTGRFAMSRAIGIGLAAVVFALVGYLCLARTRYLQGLVLRWRDLHEPSWELSFLRSPAYLWMVRFVGVLASVNALIAVWVLFHLWVR